MSNRYVTIMNIIIILQGLSRPWCLDIARIPIQWGVHVRRHRSQVNYNFEHCRGVLSMIDELLSS
jgi:hypothetical protein